MKQSLRYIAIALALIFFASSNIPVYASENNSLNSVNEFLLQTGMPLEELNALDLTTREFIVSNLKESGVNPSDLEHINIDILPTFEPNVNQLLTGVTYTVSAFRSGNIVFIYPT